VALSLLRSHSQINGGHPDTMKCTKDQGRPIVNISQGRLCGKKRKTKNGTQFCSFTRVPFASPPVGDLRFARPSSPPPWQGVLDASQPCPKPLQCNYVTGMLEGQEDCLYLNIYIPKVMGRDIPDGINPLPVMFWLYGGGFIMGDASEENYLPGPLLDTKQVIIVTANYRIGPLGFLSMEDNVIPGNFALWDQRAALQWVQNNIAEFGGNPNNVTIFGESAGSFCLTCLYVSPICRGLFHRAIVQSGPLISNCSALQVMGKRPQIYARSYAERFGCGKFDTSEEILQKLRTIPASKLTQEFKFAGDWAPMCPSPWKPVLDVWSDNPILPKDPRISLLDGDSCLHPVMLGTCKEEGILLTSHILKEPERWNLFCDDDWWKVLSMILFHSHMEDLDEEDRDMMLKIAQEYDLLDGASENRLLNDITCQSEKKEKELKLTQLFTDAYFKTGTLDLAQILASQNVPVFQYRFVYRGKWRFGDLMNMNAPELLLKFVLDYGTKGKINLHGPHWDTVSHADELHYLFSPTLWGTKNTITKEKDKHMSVKMAHHWVRFATHENPSGQICWENMESGGSRYLNIDLEESMREFDKEEIRRFNMWLDIFQERGNRKISSTPIQLNGPITKRIKKVPKSKRKKNKQGHGYHNNGNHHHNHNNHHNNLIRKFRGTTEEPLFSDIS